MHLVEEKWDEILLTVKREHELTDISFNTWLKPLRIFSIQNNRIYILVSGEQMGLTYINLLLTFRHRAGVRLYTSSFEFAQPCVFVKQLPGPILCASLITRTLYPEVTGSICLVP